MVHRDLRYCNVHIDANALDRTDEKRSEAVDQFESLKDSGAIHVVTPGSVVTEVQHPHTPNVVRDAVGGGVFTLPTALTSSEHRRLAKVTDLMRGNATDDRHDADARHLFEAAKYGGGYFITHEHRILDRADKLDAILGPGFSVVTLEHFLRIHSEFAQQH